MGRGRGRGSEGSGGRSEEIGGAVDLGRNDSFLPNGNLVASMRLEARIDVVPWVETVFLFYSFFLH
jgi:hypothetical protein